jgi:hypothetical protein
LQDTPDSASHQRRRLPGTAVLLEKLLLLLQSPRLLETLRLLLHS